MAAKLVFALSNNFKQNGSVGICTAASMAWARAVLKKQGSVKKRNEFPDDHVLNAQMAMVRELDARVADQVDKFNLALHTEATVNSITAVTALGKANSGRPVIFWNSHHTMGYRNAGRFKEFFDMECGLYRAKKTADIEACITTQFTASNYAPLSGACVVKLAY